MEVQAKNVYLYCYRLLLEERAMATRRYNNPINQDVSTRYASDLFDQEFALVRPHVAQKHGSGKKRRVDIREVLNAISTVPELDANGECCRAIKAWYQVW